jgi:hypothetical protein
MELQNLDYCNQAIEIKKQTEIGFIMLGQYLHNIREQKLYEGQWDSFPEYLQDMNLPDGTASKLINIYKKFVLEFQIPEQRLIDAGGWTKIATLLPIVTNKEDAEEWIHKASVLSIRDLQKEIKENETGVEMKACPHTDTFLIRVCRDCGDKFEVYEPNV